MGRISAPSPASPHPSGCEFFLTQFGAIGLGPSRTGGPAPISRFWESRPTPGTHRHKSVGQFFFNVISMFAPDVEGAKMSPSPLPSVRCCWRSPTRSSRATQGPVWPTPSRSRKLSDFLNAIWPTSMRRGTTGHDSEVRKRGRGSFGRGGPASPSSIRESPPALERYGPQQTPASDSLNAS